MTVYLVEKEKNRIYKSEDILRTLFDVELTHNEEGAPLIPKGYISISDTAGFWCCCMSDNPVGIDIEEERRIIKTSVAKRLHKEEQEYLYPLNIEGREWKEEFINIWVKKEAYMKLTGKGLKMGLSSFSVVSDEALCSLEGGFVTGFKYKRLHMALAGTKGDIEEHEIKEIIYEAPFAAACRDAAAGLLDSRMYSSSELRKKLAEKGYPEKDIEDVIKSFTEYGYLNDELYARLLAEKLSESKKSPRLIEMELSKKGIARDTAREAAAGFRENAGERAMELAVKCLGGKKLSSMTRDEQTRMMARIGRKLASFGYETSLIYDILDKLKL